MRAKLFHLVLIFGLYMYMETIDVCTELGYSCIDYKTRLAYAKEDIGVNEEMMCSCDTICKFFNDCCTDALSNKAPLPRSFTELSRDLVSCLFVPEVSELNYLYSVTRCPSTWPDGVVRRACENDRSDSDDFVLRVPVTGFKTGLMYKNMYCAMCHGSSYIFWVPVIRCRRDNIVYTENITFHEVYQNPGCFFKFDKPAPHLDYRHCFSPYPISSTCQENYTDSEVKERCENDKGLKLVFDGHNATSAFRNKYCALCNSVLDGTCSVSFAFEKDDPYAFYPFIMAANMNSVSVTSTFGTKYTRRTLNVTGTPTCSGDDVFDPFTMSCVAINCDAWLVITDRVCQKYTNESDQHCRRIQLSQHEYKILDNGDLLELPSGLRHAKSLYYINHTSAFVCRNVSKHSVATEPSLKQIISKFSSVEVNITVAGLSVSVIALFLTVLTFAAIKPLQNTSGKCILSLSCSLFVADLLMLIGPNVEDITAVCKGIAICMHYSFLAAFFWMNTMAVDALETVFDILKHRVAEKLPTRFPFYSIFSWTGPALIVATSVLVDTFAADSSFKPMYGVGICWLTNKNALIVFFAGPIFFIIFVNAILFAIIATKIRLIQERSRNADKSNAFIYMKLFVVIGLTWTLGFVANVIPHPVFWYLFIFLNTLQGVFIFLVFVATKRVWRLIGDRLLSVNGKSESGLTAAVSSLDESARRGPREIAADKGSNSPGCSNPDVK